LNRKTFQLIAAAAVLITGAALATVLTVRVSPHLAAATAQADTAPGIARAASPSPSPTPSPSPSPTRTPAAPVAAAKTRGTALGAQTSRHLSSLGIAAGSSLPSLSSAELNARLDQIRALGVTWIRYDIDWSNIERGGPGQYNWAAYDRVTAAATARNVTY